jgi:hypothetical protein
MHGKGGCIRWRAGTRVQHGGDGARPGLAQRAGRQQPAVADAVVIEDAQLDVAGQGQMRLRATKTGTPLARASSAGSSPTSAGALSGRASRQSSVLRP